MSAIDVAIIGGGICGTSAAAFLAEAGASVTLFERDEIAAGASGRNSGALQWPLDGPLGALHTESMQLYRELARTKLGFALAERAAGLLIVSSEHDALTTFARAARAAAPELSPEVIPAGALQRLEPGLADDLDACRLETGFPVAPASATLAFAQRAQRAGARFEIGALARPAIAGRRVSGVSVGNEVRAAGQVLIAAGPWTSELVDAWSTAPPIRPLWGVVVGVDLVQPPLHVIEELGIDGEVTGSDRLFSLVSSDKVTSVGSTFLERAPAPEAERASILRRGARFVPALARARVTGVRSCARPLSLDGRPLIGPVPGTDGLFVCAGHGPWGISTGAASARLVVDQLLGRAALVPELDPARFSVSTRSA